MAYCTRAQLRALNGLGDPAVHSDADLDAGIVFCKEVIDRHCGTTFGDVTTPAYDAFTITVDGTGSRRVRLVDVEGRTIYFPRSITSVTIDGTADSGITYTLNPAGWIQRSSGAFTIGDDGGQNVVIVGTAGRYNTPPGDVAWAARQIARQWVLELTSRMSDRALSVTTQDGSYEVRAQAGGVGRPTNLPDVNAVLNRHRHGWSVG